MGTISRAFEAAKVEYNPNYVFPSTFTKLVVYGAIPNQPLQIFRCWLEAAYNDNEVIARLDHYSTYSREQIMKPGTQFHAFSRAYYQPFLEWVGAEADQYRHDTDPTNFFSIATVDVADEADRRAALLETVDGADQLVALARPEVADLVGLLKAIQEVNDGLLNVAAFTAQRTQLNPTQGKITFRVFKSDKATLCREVIDSIENTKTANAYYQKGLDDLQQVSAVARAALNTRTLDDDGANVQIKAVTDAAATVRGHRESVSAWLTETLRALNRLTRAFASWAKSHAQKVWREKYKDLHPEIAEQRQVRNQALNVSLTAATTLAGALTAPAGCAGALIAGGVAVGIQWSVSIYDQVKDGLAALEGEVQTRSLDTVLEGIGEVSARKLATTSKASKRKQIAATLATRATDIGSVLANFDASGIAPAMVTVASTTLGEGVEVMSDTATSGFTRQQVDEGSTSAAEFAIAGGTLEPVDEVDPNMSADDYAWSIFDRAMSQANSTRNEDALSQALQANTYVTNSGFTLYGAFLGDQDDAELTSNDGVTWDFKVMASAGVNSIPSGVDVRLTITAHCTAEGEVTFDQASMDYPAADNALFESTGWGGGSAADLNYYAKNALDDNLGNLYSFAGYVIYCYDRDIHSDGLMTKITRMPRFDEQAIKDTVTDSPVIQQMLVEIATAMQES